MIDMHHKLADNFKILQKAMMTDGEREEKVMGIDSFTSYAYSELTLHMEPLPTGMDFNNGSQIEFEALGEKFFLSSEGDVEMVTVQSENDFEVYEVDDKDLFESLVNFLDWRVKTLNKAGV